MRVRTSPTPTADSIEMKSSRLCDDSGVEIGGYDGGDFIQVPSGFFMCRRSEANVDRKTDAGTTRKNRWYSGLRIASVRKVSVTYLWKNVGNGRSESRSKTRQRSSGL